MAINGNVDIEVSCDDCGATANVDVTNDVLHKLSRRDWRTSSELHCPECATKHEDKE